MQELQPLPPKKTSRKGILIAALVAVAFLVVCCCGVIPAIAIPSFIGYLARAKTAEAERNLRNLFTLAAGYYDDEQWGSRDLLGGSAVSACTVGPAITSVAPTAAKHILDWNVEAPSFMSIGFALRDPAY